LGDRVYTDEQRAHKNLVRRAWVARNRESFNAYQRAYRKTAHGSEAEKKKQKRTIENLREAVFSHYGRKCVCCGESNPKLLSLDHIDNDGHKDRRKLWGKNRIGGWVFYRWVVRWGFPKNIQTLCLGCNSGKSIGNGVCPHQLAKQEPGSYFQMQLVRTA
jgi:hypothetical protein